MGLVFYRVLGDLAEKVRWTGAMAEACRDSQDWDQIDQILSVVQNTPVPLRAGGFKRLTPVRRPPQNHDFDHPWGSFSMENDQQTILRKHF